MAVRPLDSTSWPFQSNCLPSPGQSYPHLLPCDPGRGLELPGPFRARAAEAREVGGGEGPGLLRSPGVPRGAAETWAPDRGGGRTWPRCPHGDVRSRRAPVPARPSAAERGTKRPAHSCALTHGRHVARRRRRFAQNWSGGEGGPSAAPAGPPRALPLCVRPPAQDFPKQAGEGEAAGVPGSAKAGESGRGATACGGRMSRAQARAGGESLLEGTASL